MGTSVSPWEETDSSGGGVVPPGARALLYFPGVGSRAAPRYSCLGGGQVRSTPAPPPPPAPTRAVVLQLQVGPPHRLAAVAPLTLIGSTNSTACI
jgi:hypothetical protein